MRLHAPELIAKYRTEGQVTEEDYDACGIPKLGDKDYTRRDKQVLWRQRPVLITCEATVARFRAYEEREEARATEKDNVPQTEEEQQTRLQQKEDKKLLRKEEKRQLGAQKSKQEKERKAALSAEELQHEKEDQRRARAEKKAKYESDLAAARLRLQGALLGDPQEPTTSSTVWV